jgi:hypothetical protein
VPHPATLRRAPNNNNNNNDNFIYLRANLTANNKNNNISC